jgi:MATE family multidrug resistance protein
VLAPLHGIISYANTFVAQHHGANQDSQIGPLVGQALLLAVLGGFATLLLIPAARPFFTWIDHEAAVREMEIDYLQTSLVLALPMLVMTAASSFFGGLARTWTVFAIHSTAMVVNVVLDYAMIFGHWGFPELGIAGAGWATAIGYLAAALLSLVLLWRADADGRFGVRRPVMRSATAMLAAAHPTRLRNGELLWKPRRDVIHRLILFGGPNGLMLLTEMLAWTWFEFLVGRLGTLELAATNVAFNINMIVYMPMLGIGLATQILTGQRLGENRADLAARSTWTALWLGLLLIVPLAAVFVFGPELLLLPFRWNASSSESARWHDHVVILLRFVALYCAFDMAALVFSGALRGAGDTWFVMLTTLAIATCVLVVPSYIACEIYGAGLYTAWCFMTLYVLAIGSAFFARFQTGAWRSMRVISLSANRSA